MHRVLIVQLLLKTLFMGKKDIHLVYKYQNLLLVKLKIEQSNRRIVFHLDFIVKDKNKKKNHK